MNQRQLKKIKSMAKLNTVQRLSFKKDDFLIFTIDCEITQCTYEKVKEDLKSVLNHTKIILLTGGIKFDKVLEN